MTLKPTLQWMMIPIFQDSTTAKPETIITIPVPTNKDNEHPTHALAIEDMVVSSLLDLWRNHYI
jgi:hypothetical protein